VDESRERKTYALAQENLNRTYLITYYFWDEVTVTGYYRHTDAALTFEEPVRSGYDFEGWYNNPDFSGEPVTGIPAGGMGDQTFYAKWALVQYTVTFDADEGSPRTQTRTVNSGESLVSGSSNITYSSVSGAEWTVLADGRRRSPWIGANGLTKVRISFTSYAANASIMIHLEVSSEESCDWAFISTLDNAFADYYGGYYERISGIQSVSVTIPVPDPGSHFIDIGYGKDGSVNSGSDCA
jgi:uncharacterized repeat protein (TIGR02543 family)